LERRALLGRFGKISFRRAGQCSAFPFCIGVNTLESLNSHPVSLDSGWVLPDSVPVLLDAAPESLDAAPVSLDTVPEPFDAVPLSLDSVRVSLNAGTESLDSLLILLNSVGLYRLQTIQVGTARRAVPVAERRVRRRKSEPFHVSAALPGGDAAARRPYQTHCLSKA
jgi:hypothetical protein